MGAYCSHPRDQVTETSVVFDTYTATENVGIDSRYTQDIGDELQPIQAIPPVRGEPECCALCLQALFEKPLGVCTNGDDCRTCSHYFHFSCLRKVRPRRCPQCRTSFERCTRLPDITKNVVEWGRLVTVCGRESPSRKEIVDALKAMLALPVGDVDAFLTAEFQWIATDSAAEKVTPDFLVRLAMAVEKQMPKLEVPTSPSASDEEPPSPHHMTASHDGHRSSDTPGEACSCGRIHAYRGDRVRRGPAWRGASEDGGPDQLGTIVRVEEGSDTVAVQWDQSEYGDIHSYAWPVDSSQHEVCHVHFDRIAPLIQEVQSVIGVSSSAATEFLRRRSWQWNGIVDLSQTAASGMDGHPALEMGLRAVPKLYHRCRILPDRAHVRNWFDMCPPCSCSRPDCRGGVRWNTQAARHIGREAYILKIDERDRTVLVEMTGRCNCKVWYPSLAVQPVYDPDTASQPRFHIGAAVECRVDRDWSRGVVSRVWWRPSTGWGNRASVPYYIKLHNGRYVFAPRDRDDVVRAVEPSSSN